MHATLKFWVLAYITILAMHVLTWVTSPHPSRNNDISWFFGACRGVATNEGCKYVYNLVQVHIPQPIQLITFTSKSGRGANGQPAPIMLCCKQIHDLLMVDTCSYRSFHSRATTVGSALVIGEDLQVMIRLEVVPPLHTSQPSLSSRLVHA